MAIITTNPKFTNGSGVDADTMNDIAETAINANTVATNIATSPDNTDAALVGTPTVSVTADGHLKFSNLKGATGETGATGATGAAGTNGTNGTDGVPPTIVYSSYQAGITYYNNSSRLDMVGYGGSTYSPKNASVSNIVPTDSTYWNLIAAAGTNVGGNVATANNNSLETGKIYAFTPTNIPSTASGAITGTWTLVDVPDLSDYLKVTPTGSVANAFLATNENGALLNFVTISDLFTKDANSLYWANRALTATSDGAGFNIRDNSVANMLHLGAYDSYTYDSSTGIYTVTRQTGYDLADNLSWTYQSALLRFYAYPSSAPSSVGNTIIASKSILNVTSIQHNGDVLLIYTSDSDPAVFRSHIAQTYFQYQLASSYTETYEAHHFARTGQPYIEEWKKSEADRSANLCESFSYRIWGCLITAKFKPNTTYTCVCDDKYQLPGLEIKQDTTIIQTLWAGDYSHFTDKFTFTTNSSVNGEYVLNCAINKDLPTSITKIMLNEGSTPLPYQPYEGKVVHESDLKPIEADVVSLQTDNAENKTNIERNGNNIENMMDDINWLTESKQGALGYYDTIVENADGTYTITRQTGYFIFNDASKFTSWNVANSKIGARYKDCTLSRAYYTGTTASKAWTMCNSKGLSSITENDAWANLIGLALGNDTNYIMLYLGDSYQTIDSIISYLLGTTLQYKLSTSYTEKVEKNHYARYNERFILEHNKSEAERSANVKDLNYNNTNNGISLSIVNNKFTISGTNTLAENTMIYTSINLNAGTYTISTQNVSGTSSDNFRLVVHDNDWTYHRTLYFNANSYATFTVSPDITTPVFLQVYAPAIGNTINCSGYIMLNEGSVALPYQPYEGKVVHDKVAVTTRKYNTHTRFYGTKVNAGAGFYNGGIEIREADLVDNANTDVLYAPRIGFHWGHVRASSLLMNKDGGFEFVNQSEDGYSPINFGGASSFGNLHIYASSGSYAEGIRIHPADNWDTITLCGTDNTGYSGTSALTWSIHNNDGKFYLTKNGRTQSYTNVSFSNTDGYWRLSANTDNHYSLAILGNGANEASIAYRGASGTEWVVGRGVAGGNDFGWRQSGNTVMSLNTSGDLTITGKLTASSVTNTGNIVCGNTTIYSSGSNGNVNSILIGDDVTLGDCDVSGHFGMKSTGETAGFRFFNSSGAILGTLTASMDNQNGLSFAGYKVAMADEASSGFVRTHGTPDLNSLRAYCFSGSTASNTPDGSWCYVSSTSHRGGDAEDGATFTFQTVAGFWNDNIWYRKNSGSGWTGWSAFITSQNIGSQTVANANQLGGYSSNSYLREYAARMPYMPYGGTGGGYFTTISNSGRLQVTYQTIQISAGDNATTRVFFPRDFSSQPAVFVTEQYKSNTNSLPYRNNTTVQGVATDGCVLRSGKSEGPYVYILAIGYGGL